MRQHSYFGVTHCENSEVQNGVFRNETCFGARNLHKDLFSIYLQPSVNKNWYNLDFLTLQSDDVTVETIDGV